MEDFKREILRFFAILIFFLGSGPFSEMARRAFFEKAKVKVKKAFEKRDKNPTP